jgi:hypothetical protein
MTQTPEQRIAALLRVLEPAPAAWVAAACEIPRLERELAEPPALATEPSEPSDPTPAPHEEPSARGRRDG